MILSLKEQQDLKQAVICLEQPSFIASIATKLGQPIDTGLRQLPKTMQVAIQVKLQQVLQQSLKLAVSGLNQQVLIGEKTHKVLSGMTGGIGGFFGGVGLMVELPVTTTIMLRSISSIAKAQGEDLALDSTQMACLEVFAFGRTDTLNTDYYAMRTTLISGIQNMIQQGVAYPIVQTIAQRFSLQLSEKAVVQAMPVLGAVGGASVNVLFLDYFQKIAKGHFIIRRLERDYPYDVIKQQYQEMKELVI